MFAIFDRKYTLGKKNKLVMERISYSAVAHSGFGHHTNGVRSASFLLFTQHFFIASLKIDMNSYNGWPRDVKSWFPLPHIPLDIAPCLPGPCPHIWIARARTSLSTDKSVRDNQN